MQGTLSDLRDIAVSQDLVERLMMAVCQVAVSIYTDPDIKDKEIKDYAVQWGKSPRSVATQMKELVVTIMADNTDEGLIAAVRTVFDVYASVIEIV
jgi:hypothetical protein